MKSMHQFFKRSALQCALATTALLYFFPAYAAPYTTMEQEQQAQYVNAQGVSVSDLAVGAPSDYTVKSGDTLWGISRMFLKSAWKWPELWGMNKDRIANPHLIYPGQRLFLHIDGDRAYLTSGSGARSNEVIKVSPRARFESLRNSAVPTVPLYLIEAFLEEGTIVDKDDFGKEPRVVSLENRDKLYGVEGDRIYARASRQEDLNMLPGQERRYNIFRNAEPVMDPDTNEVLGYEAQYVATAELKRPEVHEEVAMDPEELRKLKLDERTQKNHPLYEDRDRTEELSLEGVQGQEKTRAWKIIPATLDVTHSRKEIKIADRLTSAVKADFPIFSLEAVPPQSEAKIVSVYDGVEHSGQFFVVLVNVGTEDGAKPGHVFRIRSGGKRIKDRTSLENRVIQLPDEDNGDLMLFKTFDNLSYGLVLEAKQAIRVGDKLISPRDYDAGR